MTNIGEPNGDFKARYPYVKFYTDDWQRATRGLSLELRGAYLDCLCVLYETEQPLPHDDNWMAHRLHISARLWRSVRGKLVDLGKLIECEGGWTNPRVQKELTQRRLDRRTKSESATSRERVKREKSENNYENNEQPPQEQHHARASSDIRYQNTESNSPIADTGSVAAGGHSEDFGLNGSTKMIVEHFAHWLNNWNPDYEAAQKSIADACGIYGPKAVRDAFAELKADHADGKVRALSVKAFYGYCRTAQERTQRRSFDGADPKPSPKQLAAKAEYDRINARIAEMSA